ncbi:MAG: carbohydrate ABC transporter permease, partial [Clostridiaceae bacterium]|nr:carbohydrate ABC transporter permease [Clostridiaceae bacterium]
MKDTKIKSKIYQVPKAKTNQVPKAKMHQVAKAKMNVKNYKNNISRIFTHFFMIDMAFVFLFPFIYMIVTSIKTNNDLYDLTVNWIPRTIEWKNYVIAFKILEYPKFLKNSFVITAWATIGHIIACSFTGYGFARYEFIGHKVLFSLSVLSIIIPVQTIIVPQYVIFANLKWTNSYLPIIVPTFFAYGLRGGLFIFIFRQFYLGFPKALEDAAKIDGCGILRTYWQIVLPTAKSAFFVVLVLSIVWHWNDFYEPSIYISSLDKVTLPSRLNEIITMVRKSQEELMDQIGHQGWENTINNAVLMAGTSLIVLPVLTAFAFLQRQF